MAGREISPEKETLAALFIEEVLQYKGCGDGIVFCPAPGFFGHRLHHQFPGGHSGKAFIPEIYRNFDYFDKLLCKCFDFFACIPAPPSRQAANR
jgi:hypothetical protein